jgi:hypothetical protein
VAVADDDGVEEVLVEVVDELDDAVFERGGDGKEVEEGKVLNVLPEADSAGVRADGDLNLGLRNTSTNRWLLRRRQEIMPFCVVSRGREERVGNSESAG